MYRTPSGPWTRWLRGLFNLPLMADHMTGMFPVSHTEGVAPNISHGLRHNAACTSSVNFMSIEL